MRLEQSRAVGWVVLACLFGAGGIVAARADQADATGDPALSRQVAAGEFTSALAAARTIGDSARRDQWLARIAGAQMRAGEPAASYNTLAAVTRRSGPSRRAQGIAAGRRSGGLSSQLHRFDQSDHDHRLAHHLG